MINDSVIINADTNALEKIFINLLGNALKFTPAGGTITVKSNIHDKSALVEIQDTGIGISADEIPYIFDRFHQADGSSTRQYAGSGLGLALVKELMDHLNGKIEVESRTGNGTRIILSFPLSEDTAVRPAYDDSGNIMDIESLQKLPEVTVDETNVSSTSELPLLYIIDDEPDIQQYLASTLSQDFRIIQIYDGRSALDILYKTVPDLVLLDIMMPHVDGLEVCRKIKNDDRFQHTKVMLLTARIDDQSKIEALNNGADDFLTKPFSSVEVRTRLKNLIHTAQLQQQLYKRNTELSATLHELKETQSSLVHSEKLNALGTLSAGLLHEINNPLNYSMTALQILLRDKNINQNADLNEITSDIQEGMQRIKLIVSDLRSFAHPDQSAPHEPFHIQEAVNTALRLSSHSMKNIHVKMAIDDSCNAVGIKNHIIHVLINIVSNAIEAVKNTETREKNIILECKPEGDRVRISVTDNGAGIDEKTIPHIFEPFFTTRNVGEGMGLGLSICHGIIKNHGGKLEVKSEYGHGATFSFDLPAKPVSIVDRT